MICSKCGKKVSEDAEFCKNCGYKLGTKPEGQNIIFCSNCGSKNSKNAQFCKDCGKKLFEKSESKQKEILDKKDEETFECEYCSKGFHSELACLRHEKNCSEMPTKKETKEISEPIKSETIHHNTQQKSNALVVIVVIIIIVIAAIILMNMYGQQQHAASFAGQTESLIDKIFG